MKKLTRREFLVNGAALLAAFGIGGPLLWTRSEKKLFGMAANDPQEEPILVVVQLSGGNDGINTVIPYGSGVYYDARPTLQIAQKDVLPLTSQIGLHPSLAGLKKRYDEGKLAIVQGVGYPNPNRSHFRSMEIWQTAVPDQIATSGWLGRYGESIQPQSGKTNPLQLLQIGSGAGAKSFWSERVQAPVIQSLDTYSLFAAQMPKPAQNRLDQAFQAMYDPTRQKAQLAVAARSGKAAYDSVEAIHALADRYRTQTQYPNTGLASNLQLAVRLMTSGSGTKVFYTQLGGFDDHAQEKDQHARVLTELDGALAAFYDDLAVQGLQHRVLTLIFSEFGRRVKENASGGTDHGTAAPVMVLGGQVKGGLYGEYPSLTNLSLGDLQYDVDFRSVYYTIIERWMRGDGKGVLGKSYETLKFV